MFVVVVGRLAGYLLVPAVGADQACNQLAHPHTLHEYRSLQVWVVRFCLLAQQRAFSIQRFQSEPLRVVVAHL